MSPPSKTILVVGSLNTDLITRTRRLPHPGETLAAQSFSTATGGKGANQAVACARLSKAGSTVVKMVGAVGDDSFGTRLRAGLEENGIDASGVAVRVGVASGAAVIIVDEDTAQNRILFTAGANATMTPDCFPAGYFSTAGPAVVVLQLESPVQTVLRLLELADEAGVPTVFNPAPAEVIPHAYYAKVTHLILNETEAAILTGREVSHLDSEAGVVETVDVLLGRGVQRSVIITLGGRGAYFKTRGGEDGWVPPAVNAEQVVDTTGAGDTFVGAFAVALVEGRGVGECVAWASRASGKTCGKRGAQEGIPWRVEVGVDGE